MTSQSRLDGARHKRMVSSQSCCAFHEGKEPTWSTSLLIDKEEPRTAEEKEDDRQRCEQKGFAHFERKSRPTLSSHSAKEDDDDDIAIEDPQRRLKSIGGKKRMVGSTRTVKKALWEEWTKITTMNNDDSRASTSLRNSMPQPAPRKERARLAAAGKGKKTQPPSGYSFLLILSILPSRADPPLVPHFPPILANEHTPAWASFIRAFVFGGPAMAALAGPRWLGWIK
ncbi:hypothetical protein CPC08DRAFT_729641 [Agrocybe pediades]|nr:hypothetical protein CPC08DRAFT_729641 [Agrocybe pediades]